MKHISQVSMMKADAASDFFDTLKGLVMTSILAQAETLIDSLIGGFTDKGTA